MITYYTTNIDQLDFLRYTLDILDIPYVLKESDTDSDYLVIDGIPLDYIRALKWISAYEGSND